MTRWVFRRVNRWFSLAMFLVAMVFLAIIEWVMNPYIASIGRMPRKPLDFILGPIAAVVYVVILLSAVVVALTSLTEVVTGWRLMNQRLWSLLLLNQNEGLAPGEEPTERRSG